MQVLWEGVLVVSALLCVRGWCWLSWLSRGCCRTWLTGFIYPGTEMGCSLCPKELPACQAAKPGLMMNDFLNK